MSTSPTPSSQEPQQNPPMNDLTTQEPLPAVPAELTLWHWLTEPHDAQWLLPATGAWILGLDWFLFSQETISLGLAVPATAVVGFLAERLARICSRAGTPVTALRACG